MWVDNYWFPEQTQEQLPAATVGTLLATATPEAGAQGDQLLAPASGAAAREQRSHSA